MNKYLKKVTEIIIAKTGVAPEEINEASYFEDDLNIDKLELIEILGIIEEEYQMEFEEEERERIESIMDVVEILVEKLD